MCDFQSVIFDISNVIIDVNTKLTHQAFAELSRKPFHNTAEIIDNQAISPFETGDWTDEFFRNELRKQLHNPTITDAELDEAWNRMLLPLPFETLEFLLQIRKKYQIFALSNIDSIHQTGIDNNLLKFNAWQTGLAGIFENVYFSYQLRKSKPDPETYLTVLNENALVLEKTLFIDDKFENIQAAQKIGLPIFHFTPQMTLSDIPLSVS